MTDNTGGGESTDDAAETKQLTSSKVIAASPDRVYEAFVDPDVLAEWYHPPGFAAEVHDFDATEGGSYRITMGEKSEGGADGGHTYSGTFDELVPGERIVQREAPPGADEEMTVTIDFAEVAEGTEVTVTLTMPASWPDDAIGGWEHALDTLAETVGDQG